MGSGRIDPPRTSHEAFASDAHASSRRINATRRCIALHKVRPRPTSRAPTTSILRPSADWQLRALSSTARPSPGEALGAQDVGSIENGQLCERGCQGPCSLLVSRTQRPLGLSRAERSPASPLRIGYPGSAFHGPGTGRQPAVETAPALAWHDPDGARIALPIARSTSRPLLMWQRRPTTGQSERTQCAAGGDSNSYAGVWKPGTQPTRRTASWTLTPLLPSVGRARHIRFAAISLFFEIGFVSSA